MMKDFDESIRQSIKQEDLEVPEAVERRIEETLRELPPRMSRKPVLLWKQALVTAACLAVMLVGVLPNISVTYARAVEDIPVLGVLARAFTIRNYVYYDGGHDLEAEIPQVSDPAHKEAEDLINTDVNALTGAVIDRFYSELEVSTEEDHGAVYIDYETVTSSEEWFTLKIAVTEVAASSYSYEKYYHIDRTTGDYVVFGDLFAPESYPALEEMVLAQMEARMAADPEQIYWTDQEGTEGRFTPLQETQNFYFADNGDLVIVYGRYDVAPGYMGCPQFEVAAEDYTPFLKNDF